MPPLAPAPNCLKLLLIGTNQGATWMNQVFFQGTGAITGSDAAFATFAGAVQTAWATTIAPLCNPLVSLVSYQLVDLTSPTSWYLTGTYATPTVGTRTGTALPTSVAMCMSFRIRNRYRGGHSRIYVPAGNVADVQNGRTWTSAFQTTANTAAQNFHSSIDGLSIGATQVDHVVVSYFSGSHRTPENPHPAPVPRALGTPFLITSASVRTRVDTQRRRLGKETV